MTSTGKIKLPDIDLAGLKVYGKAQTKLTNGKLDIWTEQDNVSVSFRFNADKIRRHCVSLPDKYRLPFRIDMIVRHDYPPFWLLIGNGYISFGSLRDNHKIEDIAFPSGKPNQDYYSFDSSIPLGAWVDISVILNLDEMQIKIGGEERFYTRKLSYMNKRKRSEFNKLNGDGFSIDFIISKLSVLSVRSVNVTEFDEYAPVMRGAIEEGRRIKKPNPKNQLSRVLLPVYRRNIRQK